MAFSYFTVCLQSLRREWFGIDRLRLDKFMLLIRHFLRQLFQHLRNLQWCAAPLPPCGALWLEAGEKLRLGRIERVNSNAFSSFDTRS